MGGGPAKRPNWLEKPLLQPDEPETPREELAKQKARCCGHVFVLHCHVKGLAASAVLLPPRAPDDFDDFEVRRVPDDELADIYREDVPVATFEGRVSTMSFNDEATAIAGNCAVIKNYIEAAGAMLRRTKSTFGRQQPLTALPLPGCGEMDEKDLIVNEGLMISTLLPILYRAADRFKVDVAVCTTDDDAYGVAQVQRAACCPFKGGPFWMLSSEHKAEIERIQQRAQSGRLALLLGAGISISSGLPTWGGLLDDMAVLAGFCEEERADLAKLEYLDQPVLIAERMGGEREFKHAVAERVKSGRYTPAHAMLGALGGERRPCIRSSTRGPGASDLALYGMWCTQVAGDG